MRTSRQIKTCFRARSPIAPNPEELYRASELRDILIKTLEELRPILRAVFVLRDIEGLSIDQTAEVLDLSPAAVKARLWRARLQVRELLNEYFSRHNAPDRVELSPKQVHLARQVPRELSLGINGGTA
jgi:DNA-directed RNA polymerase specialized sigma24 family protein